METTLTRLSCRIHLNPGERFELPEAMIAALGEGDWLVTIEAARPVRFHDAFLDSYAPEDEGLYDDLAADSTPRG